MSRAYMHTACQYRRVLGRLGSLYICLHTFYICTYISNIISLPSSIKFPNIHLQVDGWLW